MSKAHLSDPDIESKTHEALESTGLVNGDAKGAAHSKPVSVLQDFCSTGLGQVRTMQFSAHFLVSSCQQQPAHISPRG